MTNDEMLRATNNEDLIVKRPDKMKQVVSFSGGRTSAYLVYLMEQKRINEGWDVSYIFMDTGAEHPKTYEFIKNIIKHFEIDLICLRPVINLEFGVGITYKEISIDDICCDLKPWEEMIEKYGTPFYPSGAACTGYMKTTPYKKYCDDNFGKNKYITWLGIRVDEPKRLSEKKNFDYMANISDFDKHDVLDWWDEQEFNLDLPEHLGNCVFCIKKGVNKVALAAKDEPEMAVEFMKMTEREGIRTTEKRMTSPDKMFRGSLSLRSVIEAYKDMGRDELFNTLRYSKRFDSGSCSESCEVFNEDQLSLFEEEE